MRAGHEQPRNNCKVRAADEPPTDLWTVNREPLLSTIPEIPPPRTLLAFCAIVRAMKRAFVLFGALCVASPIAAPQTASPKAEVREQMSADEAAIQQVSEDWIRFYNAGDAAKVAALYTDDGYYLSAHILAHGRQAIEAYWERGIKAGGHIDFIKPLTLYYTGDLAYCAGTYQATNAGVPVDGRILIVLRKVNGKWLMAAHETAVRDQPL